MGNFYLLGLIFALGCGGGNEDPVLAKIGDVEITASQLGGYTARLPEKLKGDISGGYRTYLQDFVDKELLLREARRRGLDQGKTLRRKLAREQQEHVLNVYLKREVYGKVAVTDEELRAQQQATGRDRAVQVRRVVVATRGEAEEIVQQLRAGADFDDFAGRTLLESTMLQGGKFLIKDNMYPLVLQKAVFPLAAGEVSEPVEFNDQYGVYQVVEDSPVELESVLDLLTEELYKKKVPPMLEALVARLRSETEFSADDAAISRLVERLEGGRTLTEAERDDALYRYRGGRFTAGEFVDYAADSKVNLGSDPAERVSWFATKAIVPRILLLAGAGATDIANEAEIASRSKQREESRLLVEMRRAAVADVLVEEGEARQFYEQHPRFFRPLEALTVQEILVRSAEEAAALMERVARGEDMGELAEAHTLRLQGKGQQGVFHVHVFETRHRELLEAAQASRAGELVGPVEVEATPEEIVDADPLGTGNRFYSLFKIVESTIGAGPEPFAKVEKRARALVRKVKKDRAFHQFLLDLRYRYKSEIEIYDEPLEDLAAERQV